jgi:hypothetical protein
MTNGWQANLLASRSVLEQHCFNDAGSGDQRQRGRPYNKLHIHHAY